MISGPAGQISDQLRSPDHMNILPPGVRNIGGERFDLFEREIPHASVLWERAMNFRPSCQNLKYLLAFSSDNTVGPTREHA